MKRRSRQAQPEVEASVLGSVCVRRRPQLLTGRVWIWGGETGSPGTPARAAAVPSRGGRQSMPRPEAAMCPFALEGLAQAVRVGRGGSKRRSESWAPRMGLGVSAQTNSAAAGRRSGAAGGHPVRAARGWHGPTKEPLPSSGPRFCPEHRWPTSCPPRGRAAQFVIGPLSRRRSAPAAPKRVAKLAATVSAAVTHAKASGALLFPKHDSLAGGPPETGAPPW